MRWKLFSILLNLSGTFIFCLIHRNWRLPDFSRFFYILINKFCPTYSRRERNVNRNADKLYLHNGDNLNLIITTQRMRLSSWNTSFNLQIYNQPWEKQGNVWKCYASWWLVGDFAKHMFFLLEIQFHKLANGFGLFRFINCDDDEAQYSRLLFWAEMPKILSKCFFFQIQKKKWNTSFPINMLGWLMQYQLKFPHTLAISWCISGARV